MSSTHQALSPAGGRTDYGAWPETTRAQNESKVVITLDRTNEQVPAGCSLHDDPKRKREMETALLGYGEGSVSSSIASTEEVSWLALGLYVFATRGHNLGRGNAAKYSSRDSYVSSSLAAKELSLFATKI